MPANEAAESDGKACSLPNEVSSEKLEKSDVLDPFMVYQVTDVFKFNMELSRTAKIAVKTSGKFIKVFPETDANVITIAEFLKSQNLDFYRKAIFDCLLRAVIKGLPYKCSTYLIAENLQEQGFKVISVTAMNSKRDGRLLPFYKVELRRDAMAKEIFQLTRLCHLVITVETVKTSMKAVQCYNCNPLHHLSRERSLPTTCCKCSGSHRSSECSVVTKENPEIKPTCQNFGLDHVSAYRGCKAFPVKPQFVKKSFAEAIKSKQQKKNSQKTSKDQPNSKAPAATHQQKAAVAEIQSDLKSIAQLVDEIKAEFVIDSFSEIKNMLLDTLQKIKQCETKEEKLFALLNSLSAFQPAVPPPGPASSN